VAAERGGDGFGDVVSGQAPLLRNYIVISLRVRLCAIAHNLFPCYIVILMYRADAREGRYSVHTHARFLSGSGR
jgi:hypothetical protein